MNPILLSALHGFFKGATSPRGIARPGSRGYTYFGAPVIEESMYRALPFESARAAGAAIPNGVTAFAFALDHVVGEPRGDTGATAMRFADVFAGGVLYEMAYKQFGLLGAVVGHMLHNFMIDVGRGVRHGEG